MGEVAQLPREQVRDPLGSAIRAAIDDRGLRVGLVAGAFLTVGAWLVVFGLSWIPGAFMARALGVVHGGTHVSAGPRLAASLFAPWVIAEHIGATGTGTGSALDRSVSVLGAMTTCILLLLIGLWVRAVLPTLRSRVIALLTAGVGSAVTLAIAAAFISYVEGDVTITHDTSSVFWISLLIIVVVGLSTFGVVARVHAPLRVALRTGGALVGLVAVTAAVAFPVIVASWVPTGYSGNINWSQDLGNGFWHWGSGIAGVAVPLAFGANSHLPVESTVSPFAATEEATGSTGEGIRLPALARYMTAHSNARLTGYASTGRTAAHVLLLVGAGLVLVLFVLATIRGVRLLGAPRALDGLRQGLFVGLAAFFFVLALKWVTASVIGVYEPGTSHVFENRWALDAGPLFQTGGELLALCGLTGLIYAAVRPHPYRYRAWKPRAGLSTLWPSDEQVSIQHGAIDVESPSASPSTDTYASAHYCHQCGHRLEQGDEFCTRCGERVRVEST